jgi:hypothetical protein
MRDIPALLALLGERQSMPHEWGKRNNDCLSFLAAAVEAQTGVDPAKGLEWKSPASAMALLHRLGGVEALLDSMFERIAPAHAHRGDIGAIADAELGMHPMLVEGATLCTPGERGLKRCPRALMVAAWDVGSFRRPRAHQPCGQKKKKVPSPGSARVKSGASPTSPPEGSEVKFSPRGEK